MRKGIKALLLAACVCSTSFSAITVPNDRAYAYQLIASLQAVSIFKETLAVGESAPLELTWSNGAHPELIYTSSDENVATVDQNGIVTGIADGTATIIVAYTNGNNSKSLDIAVSSEVEKSITYNTSELSLGDKVHKYDILHYDGKNKGSTANVINTKGSYDLVFINEKDYILPFDAEYVGDWGSCMYLAPDIEGLSYLDGRRLTAGDVIDRNTHLLCYDYYIKNADSSSRLLYPVFLPEYYNKYIGDGEIRVNSIDHDTKTIELRSVDVPADSTASMLLDVQITSEPYDTVMHGEDELDLTGLKLTIIETDGNGTVTSSMNDVTIEEAKERYEVTVTIKDDAPGSGTCQITVTQKTEEVGDTESFKIVYGAPVVKGDVNSDGELNVSDVVLLQKWLLAVPDTRLPDWNRADLCRDGKLNVFDLCLMKLELINKTEETEEKSIISGIRNGMSKKEVFEVLGTDYTDEEEKTWKYAYYYPVKSGEVFGTNLNGVMFAEFDIKTDKLINYGYALGRSGTVDERVYPYSEADLKEAYDIIYSKMVTWYGEATQGGSTSPKAEYSWETEDGLVWAMYGVNLWTDVPPESYEKGVNELVLSCSVDGR